MDKKSLVNPEIIQEIRREIEILKRRMLNAN